MKTYQLKALALLMLPAMIGGSVYGLPADRVVQLVIHSNPENSASPVQYDITAEISAVEQDGDWVGWEVVHFLIAEKATLGSDTKWDIEFPYLDTVDGLWWVEHANPDEPVPAEFAELAPVVDTAYAQDAAVPDLDFFVEGVPYVPPPGGAPYEVTGALDFEFKLQGDPDPLPDDSGDAEPIDLPDPPPPSRQ